MWDPERYLNYADERGRPFFDLVARVDTTAPRSVVDLGCGPGNLTVRLASRWPAAQITGIDSSPDMIASAKALDSAVNFVQGDVRDWHPSADTDVLNSPAANPRSRDAGGRP